MGKQRRFDIFFEKHIGFGIRWETDNDFPLHLSFDIPFIAITIGIGKRVTDG